jgi:RNAse (barnase) inhibitor barstar
MLLNLYGHKNSNSKEACFWCQTNLKRVPNIEEDIDITRTLSESYELEGHLPRIIKFIEYKNCVVDLLHLFLRISDHLFELLIAKLIKIDNNSGGDIEKRPYFKIFMLFLKNECNISNPWYVSSKSESKIKLRSLNGNERLKIFKRVFKKFIEFNKVTRKNEVKLRNFTDIFPLTQDKNKKFESESNLFYEFYKYFKLVKAYNQIDLDQLNVDLKSWLKLYLKVLWENLRKKTIPPYVHIWCKHLCEMLATFGSINKFTTQSLEKLNDFTTQYYHLCTNKINKK